MIQINEKNNCSGCGACMSICPVSAIQMKLDEEGFWYPIVCEEKCIKCGKCDNVCHYIRPVNFLSKLEKMEYHATYSKRKKEIYKSSSGGLFWMLVEEIIGLKGVVYGAYQESLFSVRHGRAESLEECQKFRKSKYLESYLGDIYKNVEEDLHNDRKVLFSGTGCQIAGLYAYLKRDYNNLLTCDVVCHGVPSIMVFKKYIKETELLFRDKVENICFRNKRLGWNGNLITLYMKSGKRLSLMNKNHPFHRGFLKGLYSRPSCGCCKYAKLPRIGDITLADYWNCDRKIEKYNEDRGVSLVVLNTEKGVCTFDRIRDKCISQEVKKIDALKRCVHLTRSPLPDKSRGVFMKRIKEVSFHYLIKKYLIL